MNSEVWVRTLQKTALLVFIIVPVFSFLFPALAGRVVWTIVVAALPLFIVLVGYHRWRKICPLAFVAQIPGRLGLAGKRKAPEFLESNYHYLALATFVFSLWLRLVATNGNGIAIAAFFAVISILAIITGSIFTGKTWCNHICPLSFIEKIYTEPNGLRSTPNSQCVKCTACKKSCPDINQENGYWKEILTVSKKVAYLSFPGLIFGFYFYYYLQSGTWDYYFGGSWTNQPDILFTAFQPGWDSKTAGFFFLPSIPRAVASFITLIVSGFASYMIFSALEILISKRLAKTSDKTKVRHVLFSIASITAFITFYSFAGAPTLRKLSIAPHFFLIVVVLTASIYLYRRIPRNQQTFAEESVAKNILKRWEWTDVKPKDLREAFLIHTIRTNETARGAGKVLAIYEEAVRQTIADSFVTREDVQKLHSLRDTLQIREEDHDAVMERLAEEQRASITDPTKLISAEKRQQLQSYSDALERYLEKALGKQTVMEDPLIVKLRAEYLVTKEEHLAVLDRLMGGAGTLAEQMSAALKDIEGLAATVDALRNEPSPVHDFLSGLIQRRLCRAARAFLKGISFAVDENESEEIRSSLCSSDQIIRKSAIERLCSYLPLPFPSKLMEAYRQAVLQQPASLNELLEDRLTSVDPYVRGVALYAISINCAAQSQTILEMVRDEHDFVRYVAEFVRGKIEKRASETDPLIEKMIALKSLSMFDQLSPQSLEKLAASCRLNVYEPGVELCSQGESGNEVFLVLSGSVDIRRSSNGCTVSIATASDGSMIGELAILDPAPRSASAIVNGSGARILSLDGESFRQTVESDPKIAFDILEILAKRLRNSTHDQNRTAFHEFQRNSVSGVHS